MHVKYKRMQASDVYSIGVLMWQISSGKEPFENCSGNDFTIMILRGEREDIIPGTPEFYSNLYKGKINYLYENIFMFLVNKSIKPISFFFVYRMLERKP